MKLQALHEGLTFVRSGLEGDRWGKKRLSWFEEGLEQLEKYKKEGELIQTEFKRMKELLQRGIEESWSELIRAPYFHAGRWENVPEDVRGIEDLNLGLHLTASSLKKAEKYPDHEITRKVIKFFKEVLPISKDVADLKGKVVKKKRDKVEAEKSAEREQKELAGHKDVKKVKRVLTQITNKLKDDIQKDNIQWLSGIVTKWKKQYKPENRKTTPREFYRNSPFNVSIVERVTERKTAGNYREEDPYKMKAGYKKIIEEEAQKITDSMIDNFIAKNSSKLAVIVKKKDNLKTVTLRRAYTDRGTIEGSMQLEFRDGSQFDVDSQLVQSYSKYGRPFVRYPTTFHAVKMPDGKRMKGKASEARMQKEFATA